MTDTPRRIFGIICLLVAVWIVTYWLYQPTDPPVTFGERPASLPLAELAREEREPRPLPAPDPIAAAPEPVAPPAAPATANAEPAGPRVEPPAFRWYTVQNGDTSLQVIARRELGDSRHWVSLAQANPYLDPAKLKPGKTRLRIPLDPSNIQGRVVEAPPVAAAPAAEPEAKPKPPAPEQVVYTVAPGDTLSGIAKRFYGDPGMYRFLYEANRDVLRTPDDVSVGDKLKIPPKPAR